MYLHFGYAAVYRTAPKAVQYEVVVKNNICTDFANVNRHDLQFSIELVGNLKNLQTILKIAKIR
ncbi:hypothetical protein T12_10815 [Trichinella patagoniensis]|uniref:Uncharacterized protein n=1 Tax=Trichinella patagoniensis TaxID=990121 RepID=A0A0V0ZGS6_9BILA|nr:hypothetical protein T12_10815 [Trichinella patagoniensis]